MMNTSSSTPPVAETGTGGVRVSTLSNGLRVVSESMPDVRSVSVGIWIDAGSRDEKPQVAGASHFLEHLLFKGTARRSAQEIAESLDAVGGDMNAFTSKEYTCFYARCLDRDLPLAVDVLGDMMTSSRVRSADVDAERDVVLEEIRMHLDTPDDLVHSLWSEAFFRQHHQHDPGAGPPLLPAGLRAGQPGHRGRRQPGPRPARRAGRGGVRRHRGPGNPPAQIGPAPAARACLGLHQEAHRAGASGPWGTGTGARRRSPLGGRRAQPGARPRDGEPVVPGGAREAWAGLHRVLLSGGPRRRRRLRRVRGVRTAAGAGGAPGGDHRAGQGPRRWPQRSRARPSQGQSDGSLVLSLEDTGSRMS